MRILLSLSVLALLAACGANGEPQPPEPGVKISGEARIGVVGTL
ncbi:MAG TPA: hypothetical protein PLH11_01090 [Gemmobacter sp.]|nr:hypothetical protein [Gemmobacter sp.]